MRAEALTPADIFGYHVRYVVPLFQRPYVWSRQDQWEPLWDDIRAVAERLLRVLPLLGGSPNSSLSPLVTPHFLGAIVVEQAPTLVGSIQVYHVIDGQQRLTTLQLLLDAAGRVAEKYGDAEDARRLRQLVVNDPAVRRDDEAGKVWPTLGDRDAYLSVMTGAPPAAGEPIGTPVTQAHAFFVEAIRTWAHEDPAAGATAVRLRALARAIGGFLRAVVIHLDPGDNAQGIFETLNHRGAPLLAADLIKNLVFRVAEAEGLDVVALYQKYWADLDGPYWRAYVKRGRQVVPRIDVFVHYWLVMRLVREVRADQIFTSFREHLDDAGPHIEELLRELGTDARTYVGALASSASRQPYPRVPDLFCYRVFGALDAGALTPFYLWLMRWPSSRLPVDQRDRALRALESWMVRRWLCSLSTKDNSNVVLDLVRALDEAGPEQAGDLTEAYLYGQKSNSRLWPTDELVRRALKTTALDPRAVRPRLRMVLEAIEDRRRADVNDATTCERDLTVEYVMSPDWRSHWPAAAPATATLRDTLIHTLGNLTLVPDKLDATDLPWTDAEAVAQGLGPTGKRTELANHGRLRVNAELVARYPNGWTEVSISARTTELADVIVRVWPKPTEAPTAPLSLPAQHTAADAADAADSAADVAAPGTRSRGRSAGSPTGRSVGGKTVGGKTVGSKTVGSKTVGSKTYDSRTFAKDMLDGTFARDMLAATTGDDGGPVGGDGVGFDQPDGDFESGDFESRDFESRDFESGDFEGSEFDGGEFEDGEFDSEDVDTEDNDDTDDTDDDTEDDDTDDDVAAVGDGLGLDQADDGGPRLIGRDQIEAGAVEAGAAEAGATSRYARLSQFLAGQTTDTIPMTFQQVEDVLEDPLPPSARTSIPYWSSTNAALGRAIVAGGFKPTNVDLWNERVIFARDASGRRPRRPRQHPKRRNSGRQGGLDR